jgi:hypothetical protein
MRSFLNAVVVVGIAVFLILVWLSVTKHTNESRLSDASEQNQPPTFYLTAGDTTYYGAISSNVGVAILAVNPGPYFLGLGDLVRADGKFIVVTVAISNRQNTAITMNTSLFEILDAYGNVYSASEKSMEIQGGNDLFLAQINPGITKAGRIVFDVPANLSTDNLQLRFRGGMTGDTAILALRVNPRVTRAPTPSEATAPLNENASPLNKPTPEGSTAAVQPSENANLGEAPIPSPSPEPTPPRSGVLHYQGSPVPLGGVVVFNNLPKARLKFSFDRSAWQPFISINPDGTKALTMTSQKQGYQTRCDVGWEILE